MTKALLDPAGAMAQGLAAIRAQFGVPPSFPAAVLAAADKAVQRVPAAHVDRTRWPFVTLDPASSTDLDQAFTIERAGADLLLRYAIADVAWFVDDSDALDVEAWARGETIYLPGGRAGLYPPALCERAASLLPDGPRPAVIFSVRIAPDGTPRLDGVERALIRSRAKLAYETVRADDLPVEFDELARRVAAAEAARGAARADPPEQELQAHPGGGFTLAFRPPNPFEQANAALSLATNLAVAAFLAEHRSGLFRVMAGPDAAALARLRRTAQAIGLSWPDGLPLEVLLGTLDPARAVDAAFLLAVRRAGTGASYAPWRDGVQPWHAAVAATYVHATAPLRRLADRYVIRAALALAQGRPVSDTVAAAFERLPAAMARAATQSAQVERAALDCAEAVLLAPHVGATMDALVIETEGESARFRLIDWPVVARTKLRNAPPGQRVTLRLTAADPISRRIEFGPA
jgi:exoribonuclease R